MCKQHNLHSLHFWEECQVADSRMVSRRPLNVLGLTTNDTNIDYFRLKICYGKHGLLVV